MLPTQRELEIPLLQVLLELDGQAEPKQVYPLVAAKFPELRDEDLAETVPSGGNRWTNRIQWVRQKLVTNGEMDSPAFGMWRITDKGRQRLAASGGCEPPEATIHTLMELYEQYEVSFRRQLLDQLQGLSPQEFEEFARKLLMAYGFLDMRVTQTSRDGGIDGYGKLRLGLATMNVAFQCKRWQANVGRPEVDKFRGAIQGEFEQGVFFTTSDFTPDARDASLRRGAVPVILLNGESIITLMIEKGFGVERVPLYAYYQRAADFTESGES
jgi:restriction system protein